MQRKFSTYEDIKREADSPHATAEALNILVSRTKEMSALKQREIDELNALLENIESKLEGKS